MDATMKAQIGGPSHGIGKDSSKGKAPEYGMGSRETRSSFLEEEREDDVDLPWWVKNPSRQQHTKMEFPRFEGGDPRGWILKAEKYFRYYQTPEDVKVDIAAMYLEGDALDLFAWINSERTLLYWEELVKALQENYGPAEFQNPDEHLCGIRQSGTIQEYRQEFAKRAARVNNWPEHCLLGVFLNGLKEELKADVRIHKPRSVYKAMSLAMEFEQKLGINRGFRGLTWENSFRSNPAPTNFSREASSQSSSHPFISQRASVSVAMRNSHLVTVARQHLLPSWNSRMAKNQLQTHPATTARREQLPLTWLSNSLNFALRTRQTFRGDALI